MNFFQKNIITTRILAVLLIVTLSALGTMVYQRWHVAAPPPEAQACGGKCNLLTEELGLSAQQEQQVGQIRMTCRQAGMAISDSLQLLRSTLVTELSKDIPDTIQLQNLAQHIGQLQARLTNQTIDQYLKISKVCTPGQRKKLSSLYFEMMGCCRQGNGKGMKKGCMNE